jgi:putative tryptophan/tyrosine transport system substrate-binding protein
VAEDLQMIRREFIRGLGAAALAWPRAARAQFVPTVGFLFAGSQQASFTPAFLKGLSEMGFVEGRNVAVEYRWAEDRYGRLPGLAAELVRQKVAVIFAAGGSAPALAAKVATAATPIVFNMSSDPVEAGLVASFNRPGGNVTGISFLADALNPKRLGLLHDIVPAAARFAMLVNPGFPSTAQSASMIAVAQAAALTIGRHVEAFYASIDHEIDAAFADMVQRRADALLISVSPLFANRTAQLTALATRHALPAIHFVRGFVEDGGLMSYGASIADATHQAGVYVGRILKGEKPADLPVVQPTKFELVINLKTAKALGLTVPNTLLVSADEVIE